MKYTENNEQQAAIAGQLFSKNSLVCLHNEQSPHFQSDLEKMQEVFIKGLPYSYSCSLLNESVLFTKAINQVKPG